MSESRAEDKSPGQFFANVPGFYMLNVAFWENHSLQLEWQ
jgi:hypothetical protein